MKHRNLAMLVLIFASFMDLLDVTIVNVALPSIQEDLHASPAQLEWIVGGYTLAFALVLITAGRLGDILGRRTVFQAGVAGFTAASLAACLAGGADLLVASRIIQGGFAAVMVPQVLASAQALYAPKERAAVFGVFGAVNGMAAVVGPLLGGWLVSADAFGIGWRSIFVINVPVGVVLLIAAALVVPNTRSAHAVRPDLSGFALSTVALGLLVYPLIEGRALGWPSWIWALLVGSVVAFGVLIRDQRRKRARDMYPLIPLSLFANRGFSAGSLVTFSFQGSVSGFFLILTLYLQLALGFSAIGAGLVLLPFSLGAFLGSGVSAPLGHKAGKARVIGGALLMSGALVFARHILDVEGSDLSGWSLLWPMALAGLGLGLLVVPLVDLALAGVDVRDAGAASGVFSTFQQVGGALGIAIVGTVFFGKIGTYFSVDTIRDALLTASLICIGGFVVCAASATLLPANTGINHDDGETDEPAPATQEEVFRHRRAERTGQ